MRSLTLLALALSALLLSVPAEGSMPEEAASPLMGKQAPEISLSGGVNGVTSRTKIAREEGHPVLMVFWNPG